MIGKQHSSEMKLNNLCVKSNGLFYLSSFIFTLQTRSFFFFIIYSNEKRSLLWKCFFLKSIYKKISISALEQLERRQVKNWCIKTICFKCFWYEKNVFFINWVLQLVAFTFLVYSKSFIWYENSIKTETRFKNK